MKRRIALLLLLCMLASAAVSSCASPQPGPGGEGDGGLMRPNVDVKYIAIKPVNAGRAQEIRIILPEGMEQPNVIAMPDGGALALGQKVEYGALKKVESSKIIAARYDPAGNTLWTKVYGELPDGYVERAQSLHDNGFVFVCGAPAGYGDGQNVRDKEIIAFCGADGNVSYHESSNQTGLYRFVFECDTGICAVGDAVYQNGRIADDPSQTGGENALTILAQGAASSVFFSRSAKAEGYFSPMAEAWSKETGLVISAYKQDTGGGSVSEILAYDADTLEQQWQYGSEAPDRTIFSELLATQGGLLVSGYTGGSSFILKLGPDGKKLWQVGPDGGGDYSVLCTAALADGGFAAAINRYQESDAARGVYLATYDANGKQLRKIILPNEIPGAIQPLPDGGLMTVGIQNIKVLPAPGYVSAIWYDTETIATRYDSSLNIAWRKIYDKYKNSIRRDVVVPTVDGKVIVEK